jgi:hypothetical protein
MVMEEIFLFRGWKTQIQGGLEGIQGRSVRPRGHLGEVGDFDFATSIQLSL